ncbi:putative uncharacterized protein DDB_G0282133 isoform X2 [Condylostylus longicornis]|uniref:putative uncharacterized protein DDB_G0282133 isoform X2 n=1 Tax=Condylostylus longicornis TaxID=2530218 RepID=UPI00244DA0E5|nr:putative uncharacterized protein DDB_G0282133 isoform X2 [Condylostylus longicornis]
MTTKDFEESTQKVKKDSDIIVVKHNDNDNIETRATTTKYNQQKTINSNHNNNSNCINGNLNNSELINDSDEMLSLSDNDNKADSDSQNSINIKNKEAKSLPLHCIVESVPSLQASLAIDQRNIWKRRPNIETDSYVIIAASTPWSDIVSTALQRLGYSIDISSTARGSLIIKNWKPIPLENISDNPIVPVSDILGELTSVVTLRIVILRSKPSTYNEIKDKLLKLLVLQSHAVLRSTGCPLDESMLSQICRSSYQNSFSYNGDIPDELRRKFDQWWSNQLSPHSPIPTPKILPFMTGQSNDIDFPTPGHVAAAAAAAAVAAAGAANSTHSTLHNNREQLLAAAAAAESHHSTHHPAMMVHPALHSMHHSQYPNSAANQKTRMRTSFDPEMELPKLQRWFQENPHPSRQQIQSYVIQLNSLDSRRGRKPLDVNNVVYWFKNARAAQKRSEIRLHGIGNGYLKHDGHTNTNGSGNLSNSRQSTENMLLGGHSNYLKSSPNMKFDDIDNISQHSDDDDDIEEDDCTSSSRPNSPPQHLPLSLTMHERNRDSLSSNPSHENITIKSEIINGEIGSELSSSNNNDINGNNNSGNNSSSNNNNLSEPNNQSNDKNVNNSERISSDRNNIPEKNTNGDRNSERSSPNDQRDNNDRNSLNSHSNVNDNIHNNSMKSNNNNNNNNGNNSNINSSNDIEQQSNESPKNSLKSEEDLDMEDDNDISQMDDGFRSPSPDPRRDLAFPMVPNPMLSHSFMYMSHYMPSMGAGHHQPGAPGHVSHSAAAAAAAGLGSLGLGGPNGAGIIGSGNASGLNLSNLSNEERRKRNRTFIDPVTEVPKLEQWFALNTHPSHNQILKYTEDLNQMPYRQKFPRLESKNVQFWFKNRRAKCKRLKMSLYDSPQCSQLSQLSSLGGFGHNLKFDDRDSMTAHSMKYDDRDRME